jgi:Protein of unknown function (DUF2442)
LASSAGAPTAEENRTAAVTPPEEIVAVRVLHDHWLRLWFEDGAVIDVDAGPIVKRGGVFEPIGADRLVFEQVCVRDGTIAWPNDVDLCPDVLYGHGEPADGTRFERRVVQAGRDSVA